MPPEPLEPDPLSSRLDQPAFEPLEPAAPDLGPPEEIDMFEKGTDELEADPDLPDG